MTDKLDRTPGEGQTGPRIVVIGVGGAGGNAVNNMINSKLAGVEFLVANTDAQAIGQSLCDHCIQLGRDTTRGLGAGSRPDVGRVAAEEALGEILAQIEGAHMVFITAGMGGGTGTGGGPVIARAARDAGILTVGVVTKPFHFEGARRMRLAEEGIIELTKHVDTLIIIPNQNLFRIANEKTTFADAFKVADDVLNAGVRGVTDLMVMPGLINLDFADIRSVMTEMGKAIMGTGEAEGENRAILAAEAAISNPLLDEMSMKGARGLLINITGGLDLTLFEVDQAANRIRDEVDPDASIIFGSAFDQSLEGRMRVSVVATGIDAEPSGNGKAAPLSLVVSRIAKDYTQKAGGEADEGADNADSNAANQVTPPLSTEAPAVDQPPLATPPVSPVTESEFFRDETAGGFGRTGEGEARPAEEPISNPETSFASTPLSDNQPSRSTAISSSEPVAVQETPANSMAGKAAPTLAGIPSPALEQEKPKPFFAPPAKEQPKATFKPDSALTNAPRANNEPVETAPENQDESSQATPPRRKSNGIFSWMTGSGSASAEESFDKGDRYYYGQGVRKNLALALRCYRKAADTGHAGAQNRLGWMYEKGEGIEADYGEAAKWYLRAADQGHVNAMNDLGYMYRQGWGVAQSYSEALRWFRQAAEKYDSYAEYNMGQMFENGWGVDKDMDEAVRWFRRSAARGHEWAAKRLEELGIHT